MIKLIFRDKYADRLGAKRIVDYKTEIFDEAEAFLLTMAGRY